MRLYALGLVLTALLFTPLTQDPVNPPPKNLPPPIGVVLSGMQTDLDALFKQAQLNQGEHERLTATLDRAHTALRHGEPLAVVKHLDVFGHEVHTIVTGGVLDDKTAQPLLDGVKSVQQTIADILNLPGVAPPVVQLCLAPVPCKAYLVLHVAAHGGRGGVKPDGSAAAPYLTIGDALARAVRDAACGLELVLAAGDYDESVPVDRPLHIRGAGAGTSIHGSILNHGGHPLTVEGLRLLKSPDPGAIVVDTCPAAIGVSNVVIAGAVRNGIDQSLGSLRATDVTVRDTVALADDRHAGFGIRLFDVQAVLGGLQLTANGAGGLSVEGPGARAYIATSEVLNNNLNPHFPISNPDPDVIGAGIVADNGALLLAEFTDLRDNEFVGLHVRNGARAHFRYGSVARTRALGMFGGYNISINDDAQAELVSFTSADADLVGLAIYLAQASASDGVVAYAPIGVVLTPPVGFTGSLFDCLRSGLRVILHPDQLPYQGPIILPCDPDLTTCPPPPPCVTVPFDCPWCL